jgi:hypothetical protein
MVLYAYVLCLCILASPRIPRYDLWRRTPHFCGGSVTDLLSCSRSMSLSEVMGAGVLTFSFTLHSCFIWITGRMLLKWSSLSLSVTLSLIFCALIHWIFLLWLGVRPRGDQQGLGAVSDVVVLEAFFCPESREIRWSSLGNWIVCFGGRCELVSASVLISAFTSRALSYSVVTSS